MSLDMTQPNPLMFVDEEAENIKQWYVVPSIRFIALSYGVSTSLFYNLVLFCEKIPLNFERSASTLNCYRRLFSVLKKLSLTEYQSVKGAPKGRDKQEKLFIPTIFSDALPELMVSAYNTLAADIGAAEIPYEYRKLLSARKNIVLIDEKIEAGYAFCEAVALAAVYLSHRSRAVSRLNKPVTTHREQENARKRYKKIQEQFETKLFRDAVIRLFITMSKAWCRNEYKQLDFEYTREFRLPEKFRSTRDTRHAVAHHYIEEDAIDRSQWDEKTKQIFQRQHRELKDADHYAERIAPLVELVLTGTIPDRIFVEDNPSNEIELNQYIQERALTDHTAKQQKTELKIDKVRTRDYLIACQVAETVDCYIDHVFSNAKQLLSLLNEARV